ncbi:hypothetical protein L596_008456 [Steinernema carpocapsae]|uniref:K Homology domain-containing protein n=1 Tax=Steinernema carpocapsae TaxID=34508 RepID=A0A4U5PCP3_STECR|nr:hypothetical protein L596_008456 [Steinernema carpocapsae]
MADSAHSQGGQDGHGGPGGQYGYGYGGPGYGGGVTTPRDVPRIRLRLWRTSRTWRLRRTAGTRRIRRTQGGQGRFQMEMSSPLDAEIQVVIREIHNELAMFEQAGEYGEQFKNAKRLLAAEAEKLENSVDPEWLEVDIPKQIKVTKKVLIPNFRHPHFNFVGKVLGPRGQTLQAIAKQFKCHIYVLGRGSTKDRAKEQEQLNSGDPQYSHFGGPLHVKVETIAPPHIAYGRIAGVLEVLSNTLIPVRDAPDAQGIGADKPKDEDGGQEGENGKDDGDRGNGDDNERRGGGGPRGGRGGYRGRGGPPSAMGIGGIRGRGMIRKHPMGPPMGGGYQGGFGGRGGRGGGPPRGGPGFRPY